MGALFAADTLQGPKVDWFALSPLLVLLGGGDGAARQGRVSRRLAQANLVRNLHRRCRSRDIGAEIILWHRHRPTRAHAPWWAMHCASTSRLSDHHHHLRQGCSWPH